MPGQRSMGMLRNRFFPRPRKRFRRAAHFGEVLEQRYLLSNYSLYAVTDVSSVSPNDRLSVNILFELQESAVAESRATAGTGLALRIHFDSSQLNLVPDTGISNIHEPGFNAVQVQPDRYNSDYDRRTDTLILFAWIDIGGQWDAGVDGPTNLATAEFEAQPTFERTMINLTVEAPPDVTVIISPLVLNPPELDLFDLSGGDARADEVVAESPNSAVDGSDVDELARVDKRARRLPVSAAPNRFPGGFRPLADSPGVLVSFPSDTVANSFDDLRYSDVVENPSFKRTHVGAYDRYVYETPSPAASIYVKRLSRPTGQPLHTHNTTADFSGRVVSDSVYAPVATPVAESGLNRFAVPFPTAVDAVAESPVSETPNLVFATTVSPLRLVFMIDSVVADLPVFLPVDPAAINAAPIPVAETPGQHRTAKPVRRDRFRAGVDWNWQPRQQSPRLPKLLSDGAEDALLDSVFSRSDEVVSV